MSFLERTGLNRFNPAQGGVRGMRVIAGALLLCMAGLFLFARLREPYQPGWGFVRAFAEAAMVGGLADWFAVTALFRHPLGIPIPHTAIIPRNKDRIGDSLADFLQNNFLTASIVAERLDAIDVAAVAGRWLAAPPSDGRWRQGIIRLSSDMMEVLDHQAIAGLVKTGVSGRLRQVEVAPLLGRALEQAMASRRHLPVIEAFIDWAARMLSANEETIRTMVHERAGWFMRLSGLDDKVADKIVDGLTSLFADVSADPEHPLRQKTELALDRLAVDLQHDAQMKARIESIKTELIDNPAVASWMEGLWDNARVAFLEAMKAPAQAQAGGFGAIIRKLGETLLEDEHARSVVNQYARRAVVGVVADYGGSLVALVSDTIRGWDARTITDRLEAAVGRDLQYIRINGTLVGGLVGLLIHSAITFL